MKKVYLQFLFCMLPTYAIPPSVAAALMGTAPVTVPGTYYWYKTKKMQASCGDDCYHEEHELRAPFLQGAVFGAMPGPNVLLAGLVVLTEIPKRLFGKNAFFYEPDTVASVTGFVGGISLYATIPLALEYARKGARR